MFNLIKVPTLAINKDICTRNIIKMFSKALDSGINFRPHFKTHQSIEIGEWFKAIGVKNITVSSISMAKYFADSGWDDITVALPVNIREIDQINELAAKIKLNLIINSMEVLDYLQLHLKKKVNFLIEIKVNYQRSGIDYQEFNQIVDLIFKSNKSKNTKYLGLISHFGETYRCRNNDEITQSYKDSLYNLLELNYKIKNYLKLDKNQAIVSIGDTPSCSIIEQFEGIDEIRPGNFVFYDLMQVQIGSCAFQDISAFMLCPIVEKDEKNKRLVIYGGSVHFNKDSIIWDGNIIYGMVCLLDEKLNLTKIYKDSLLVSLSQEHGIIEVNDLELFINTKVGDLISIIPVHSCLTANQHKDYYVSDGSYVSSFSVI